MLFTDTNPSLKPNYIKGASMSLILNVYFKYI